MIGQYCERRDVVRASCRLLVNISHYSGVTNALEKLGILEKLLDCVSIHKETRDVVESTALLLKGIQRRNPPSDLSNKASLMGGLLTVFRSKIKDEEVAKACSDLLLKVLDSQPPILSSPDPRTLFLSTATQSSALSQRGFAIGTNAPGTNNGANSGPNGTKQILTISEYRNIEGKIWEYEAVQLAVRALDHMCVGNSSTPTVKIPATPPKKDIDGNNGNNVGEKEDNSVVTAVAVTSKVTPSGSGSKGQTCWSKHTPKSISSLLMLIELISVLPKMLTELTLYEDTRLVLQSLLLIMPVKNSDLSRRIERLLSKIHSSSPVPMTTTTSIPTQGPKPSTTTNTGSEDTSPAPVTAHPPPLFPSLSSRSVTSPRPSSKESAVSVSVTARVAVTCKITLFFFL